MTRTNRASPKGRRPTRLALTRRRARRPSMRRSCPATARRSSRVRTPAAPSRGFRRRTTRGPECRTSKAALRPTRSGAGARNQKPTRPRRGGVRVRVAGPFAPLEHPADARLPGPEQPKAAPLPRAPVRRPRFAIRRAAPFQFESLAPDCNAVAARCRGFRLKNAPPGSDGPDRSLPLLLLKGGHSV